MIWTWRVGTVIWDFSVVSERSNCFYLIELMVTLSFPGECTGWVSVTYSLTQSMAARGHSAALKTAASRSNGLSIRIAPVALWRLDSVWFPERGGVQIWKTDHMFGLVRWTGTSSLPVGLHWNHIIFAHDLWHSQIEYFSLRLVDPAARRAILSI